MNKTFDKNRFWTLLKWDVLMNKKFYLQMGIGLMVALSFIFCLNTWVGDSKIAWGNDYYLAHLADMVVFVEFVVMMAAASYMFYNMTTKQQRILFLMHPASNLEKYLARFVSMTVGVLIVSNIAIIAADLIHQVFCLIIGSDVRGSVVMHLPGLYDDPNAQPSRLFNFNINGNAFSMPWLVQEYAALIVIMSIHAFYMLCGSLFRRNAWLLAICSHFLLTFLGALVLYKIADWGLLELVTIESEAALKALIYLAIILGTIFTATLYWLSYKIFTRMQVVQNKWLNL